MQYGVLKFEKWKMLSNLFETKYAKVFEVAEYDFEARVVKF